MLRKRLLIAIAFLGFVAVVGFTGYRIGFFAPHVYLSGQKAFAGEGRIDGQESKVVKTTICFWLPSMDEAALAAVKFKNPDGSNYFAKPGYISLVNSDKYFYHQMTIEKDTDYGLMAKSCSGTEVITPGKKHPVMSPQIGPAVLYLSDGADSPTKGYNIKIMGISGNNFTFTLPEGRKLNSADSGSPIVQNNAFVGAAQVDSETMGRGLSAPVMYRELVKAESGS